MSDKPCPLCGREMAAIETYPGCGELHCIYCDLTISGNAWVHDNYCTNQGGVASLTSGSYFKVFDNPLIENNRAGGYGGALACSDRKSVV